MSSEHTIYLDNAATTRVDPKVLALTVQCMTEDYGNPASAHHYGITAERAIKQATRQLKKAIGDHNGDLGSLYWTSGGTESDALAVIGAARARQRRGKHLIYSAIEHPAVRNSCALLCRSGWSADAIVVQSSGVINISDVLERVTDETTVCSVMLVNNEIGTIQPVAEIATQLAATHPHVHLHCDAVQALGKIPIDVHQLGVHSLALAAHKIHGPKGIGALWLRKDATVSPLWGGGGQQEGIRPGTHNVPGIAAMGLAAELATTDLPTHREQFERQRNILRAAAEASRVPFLVNGDSAEGAPHILSLAFRGVPAEPLLHVLESRGLLVSAGSACAERDRKPSPVLTAIGLDKNYGTIRLSLGRDSLDADIVAAAQILSTAVKSFV